MQVAYTFADRREVRTWTQKAQATTSRCIQEAVRNGLDSVAIGFECKSGVDRSPAAVNLVRSSLERDGFIAQAHHCTTHLDGKARLCSSCMCAREKGPRGQEWEQTRDAFYARWQAAARVGGLIQSWESWAPDAPLHYGTAAASASCDAADAINPWRDAR